MLDSLQTTISLDPLVNEHTTHQVKSSPILIVSLGWLQREKGNEKCLSILNYKEWKSGRRLEVTLGIHRGSFI